MATPRLYLVHDDESVTGDVVLDDREIAVLLSDDVVSRIMDMLDARRERPYSFRLAEGVFDS